MSRDLRIIGARNIYTDRCYFYDSTAVDGNKLKQDAQPMGRFYKKDVQPFQWERMTVNGIATNRRQFIGTIETIDHVESLRPDMYVQDQTGMLFIVVAPVISDDLGRTKMVGTRPATRTTLTLRGVEIKDG